MKLFLSLTSGLDLFYPEFATQIFSLKCTMTENFVYFGTVVSKRNLKQYGQGKFVLLNY
jgi:hypothetical protein